MAATAIAQPKNVKGERRPPQSDNQFFVLNVYAIDNATFRASSASKRARVVAASAK